MPATSPLRRWRRWRSPSGCRSVSTEAGWPTLNFEPGAAYAGVMSSVTDSTPYRGRYADGPPPEALFVRTPPLALYGWAEFRRQVTINLTVLRCVLRALARWALHPRRRRWTEAAAEGVVDAFVELGPMFIKLGQLLGSSPSICPATLSEAARRCIREVDPLDVGTVKAAIEADLGRPVEALFASF